ncbi:uncharacterized protein KIAA1522 homolog isoform X1 [Pygocentrus nattereri]|uniref:Uncharacterized protein n=1 Tax=Pygocentrus nattereri TaxID=42514 RepID=A0A3B4BUD1_PYGNA|nr:uncharacterized protein KIAA1522 homolog isoform X1 [Pygocentrus nattereri]XP_017549559.1 uncharacterized protein KIAA1522 homolog isoform X1 [Pygocentrus nattereri]
MSRSSSVGDLVPKDITEVLALQSKVSKGKNKRGSSLGRAFSWFKGSKQKRSVSNGQSMSASLAGRTAECATIRQGHANHDSTKAGQKQDEQRKLTVHYTASQHYQENVFIEGNRPKYLEDLHTEAQEGLKILQQEEHNNGVDFKDDQTVCTDSPQEKDACCQEGDEQLDFESTADHSITSVSSTFAASSRPVLTRQGSTFKPLNTVKRLDKTKKRTRRTTIMGIPQQVQRELCMGKGVLLQQLPNNENDNSSSTVIIPTIDGGVPIINHEGARVHLQDIEALQASRDEQLLRHHLQAVYRDDLLLNRKLGPRMSPMQRPKSLAVPGMTTSSSLLQEPQGPVMSISPQATYLSTIIPNAVLPAAIDVIEIDRSRSRRSVRTVSKSSLASASPGSSRSGGGIHDVPPSNNSKRSHSQSSETVASNPSTISFRGNAPPLHPTDSTKEVTDLNQEEQRSQKSSSSWLSSSTKAASHKPEQEELSENGESVRNSQLFSRSLSVTKAKLPPAPPRRTYSLHQEKLKQRSREQVDIKDLNNLESNSRRMNGDVNAKEDPTSSNNENKPTHYPVTAFLDDTHSSLTSNPQSPDQDYTDAQTGSGNSSPQNKFERTMSPSSGYSSQSGTPTHPSKDICPTSPGKHKVKPPKPERMGARTSPVVSVSSSMNSLSSATTDPAHLSIQTHTIQSQPPKVSTFVTAEKNKVTPVPSGSALRDLFNIPPPPKVKAPCSPPPETWAHNKRTVELLCGPSPCPNRIYELQKQQQKDSSLMKIQDTTDHTDQTSVERHTSLEIKTTEPHSEHKEVTIEAKNEAMPVQKQVTLDEPLVLRHKEHPPMNEKEEERCPERETASVNEKQEERNLEDQKMEQESPVISEKVPSDELDQRVPSSAQQLKTEKYQLETSALLLENDNLTPKTESTDAEDQNFVKHCTDKDIQDHTPTKILSSEPPRVAGNSPPPSPPPAHHPPPPPKKSPASSVSTPLLEKELQPDTEKECSILECSWPPPPPPLEESSDLVFEVQDEIDFPPPPPPLTHETLSDMSDDCNMESTRQGNNMAQEDSSYVPDITNQEAHNSEKSYDEQPTADATLNGPEVSDEKSFDQSQAKPQSCENISVFHDLVCSKLPEFSPQSQDEAFQQLPEVNHLPPQQDPPNPPIMLAKDLSKQVTPEAPVLTTEVVSPASMEDQSTFNFRRQPSLISKDNRSKELLSRPKSAAIPKEDANIPLVTPSLLQMVRLRSVNVEDQVNVFSEDCKPDTEGTPGQDQGTPRQVIPQKPIRKSYLKSTQSSAKSSPAMVLAPSMRLQEAIRMKTAAMTSSGVPARLSLRLPTPTTNSNEIPVLSPKTQDSCDLHKSPASTASFIFSKSTKKVVIETPTSPEVQATLKQNLAAELMQFSNQAKSTVTNETKKNVKVPPPVAKKPAHATNPVDKSGTATALAIESSSSKQKNVFENGQIENVQPAGQRAQSPETKTPASTIETASTLEVS